MPKILVIGNPPSKKGSKMKNLQKTLSVSASGVLGVGAANMLGDQLAKLIVGDPSDESSLRNANLVSASAGIIGAAGTFYATKKASQQTKTMFLNPLMAGMIISSSLKVIGTLAPNMAANFIDSSPYANQDEAKRRMGLEDFLYNKPSRGMGDLLYNKRGSYTQSLVDKARKSSPYGAMNGYGQEYKMNDFLFPASV
jgi:hypothetical protein